MYSDSMQCMQAITIVLVVRQHFWFHWEHICVWTHCCDCGFLSATVPCVEGALIYFSRRVRAQMQFKTLVGVVSEAVSKARLQHKKSFVKVCVCLCVCDVQFLRVHVCVFVCDVQYLCVCVCR